jgi:hypothetical protein
MSKLSEKILGDIKVSFEDLKDDRINKSQMNDLIKKLVEISIKLETSQTDIESSSKEFQNYMYEKIK